ncbi:hypothetical protein Ancab_001127 [Ancistrocladus abbreviatus]
MVVNIIKWRPWPPPQSKRFEATVVVHSVKGLQLVEEENKGLSLDGGLARLMVEIKWKGSRINGLRALRRRGKRNYTREEGLRDDGCVQWNEEFRTVCAFSASKDGIFQPWEVVFIVFRCLNERPKNRVLVAGPAVLNIADFASVIVDGEKELEITVPLSVPANVGQCSPSLCLSLNLMELRASQEPPEAVPRPIMSVPLSPCFGTPQTIEKDDATTVKERLRKVKSLTEFASSRKSKKAYHGEVSSDGKFSTGSEDSENTYPFDTDSFDVSDEDSEETKENTDVKKSYDYGTLVSANLARRAFGSRIYGEDEDRLYYSNHKLDIISLDIQDSAVAVSEQTSRQSPKLGILTWKTRKLSFRSPKGKGEPLLKKEYAEDGGDDIDFDRRLLSSSDESPIWLSRSEEDSTTSVSEFGDDNFTIGSWECKEVTSRDGRMKLRTKVFFASIDQRHERAAGEGACTALVAVIADWLHSNRGEIPIKSEFDSLIREGSLQWRKLCENEAYRERFPDKHFDLETVLQAKIRPLSVIAEKSFIGFFHPEGLNEDGFNFLVGAMSFDSIWDEICQITSECPSDDPLVYVVSWNDHFFILKVDQDAFYIVDTLGERLYEGCNQAYVLKFDGDTIIERIPTPSSLENEKSGNGGKVQSEKETPATKEAPQPEKSVSGSAEEGMAVDVKGEEDIVICKGKESCKEYIKSFLAAIPIRELQADIKRGLMAATPLHHRLQIEFQHTQFSLTTECTAPEAAGAVPGGLAVS